MEIRNTSANDPNSKPERIDITRKNREAIQSRQPLTPKPDKIEPKQDPSEHAKAVLAARDQHRAQHQVRIANARLHYTANREQAAAHASDVANARDVYEARIAKAIELRTQRAAAQPEATGFTDKLELSSGSQQLAQLFGGSNSGDAARAQHVADLKQLYGRDALNTPDLIARAAYRMLGGE